MVLTNDEMPDELASSYGAMKIVEDTLWIAPLAGEGRGEATAKGLTPGRRVSRSFLPDRHFTAGVQDELTGRLVEGPRFADQVSPNTLSSPGALRFAARVARAIEQRLSDVQFSSSLTRVWSASRISPEKKKA